MSCAKQGPSEQVSVARVQITRLQSGSKIRICFQDTTLKIRRHDVCEHEEAVTGVLISTIGLLINACINILVGSEVIKVINRRSDFCMTSVYSNVLLCCGSIQVNTFSFVHNVQFEATNIIVYA